MIQQRKKIAVLHPRFVEMGGAIKMMIHLHQKLSKTNDVSFFTTSFNLENFDNKFKIPVMEISSRFKIISYFIIAYKIRNFDIVFTGNSPMHFVGVLSKILFGAKFKLIWWNHHFPWYYNKKHNTILIRFKKIIERFSLKYIDVLVANSLYIKESLLDIFGQDRQIKILHPVVSSIFTGNKGIKSKQNDKITIFTYSRWVTGKNIGFVFELFDALNLKHNFNLIIGGEGNELNKYIDKYKTYRNITFLGKLSEKDILKYSNLSDIFIFPSLIDSFGMSILEMMFSSLPIVGFNAGGVFELIKDGKNGFLCESNLDFIEKTKLLIKDSVLRTKMGEQSLYISNNNFSFNKFKEELENILT